MEKIPIEISARHVHLTKGLVEILFGANHELSPSRSLSQPSEFLSTDRVAILGPKGKLEHVAVLGPVRDSAQVEVSLTDARKLGLTPPLRESGDVDGSEKCRLVGPAGEADLEQGVIIARRHLHCSPAEAEALGLKSGDHVSVEVKDSLRPLVFKDVVVRVKDSFALSLHVDTDEGNAAGLTDDSYSVIAR